MGARGVGLLGSGGVGCRGFLLPVLQVQGPSLQPHAVDLVPLLFSFHYSCIGLFTGPFPQWASILGAWFACVTVSELDHDLG